MSKDAPLPDTPPPQSPTTRTSPVRRPEVCARGARVARAIAAWIVAAICWSLAAGPARADVELPEMDPAAPVVITAQAANHWQQGEYEVWLLRGRCRIQQGAAVAQSDEAVLWIDSASPLTRERNKVIAYLEGNVVISWGEARDSGQPGSRPEQRSTRLTDRNWFGRFETAAEIRVHAARVAGRPAVEPAVYRRAWQRRQPPPSPGAIRRTQFVRPLDEAEDPRDLDTGPAPGSDTRRILVVPRSNVAAQVHWFRDPKSDDWIGLINSGVNLIVYGVRDLGVIDVVADRLVIWTRGFEEPDLSGEKIQAQDIPLEIYMEGNIVFRQGERVIYAERMYYDVANQVGTVLKAEVLTPVPEYEGLLRLKAEILRQTGEGRFFAREGWITSSRLGEPGYRIQAGEMQFEDIQRPALDPATGQPLLDPVTGQPVLEHERAAVSRNNFLYLGRVPIFYWPTLATDLTDPTFYIRRVRIKNDSVYGMQLLTNWSGYELLGIRNRPQGTDWDISLDWLGKRGLGHGTTLKYDDSSFPPWSRSASGLIDFWAVNDHGADNLGEGRRGLVPEKEYRHKLFWQHRQDVLDDYQLTAEFGWLSDRNFLEEYFKREWDELKDMTTGVELGRTDDNMSLSVRADARINSFFTQTEWLPRADHFWLGQPLLGRALTWYEHTSIGYARLRPARPPENPADAPFDLLPWELPSDGERLITRHEIDYPVQLGPVKLVPFALGELAHWGEDLMGDDLQRAYWQAGIRASLPVWRVDPTVENQLLNVHGLAHKVVFDAELAFADANRDLGLLPLYEPLDDDSIEAFRRRLAVNTLANPAVPQFDSRSYALRTGMGGWVAAPSMEIADDLTTLRLGMRHRWQTKRGMPGSRRIIDWIVLDTDVTWFPDNARDNFGEPLGLVDYDFRWHIGDRLTLVSDGLLDFFPDGQRVVDVGGFLSRPPRGDLYLGLRLIDGPISHRILTATYSYRLSDKWLSSLGMSVDLGGEGNIGQRFMLTRIGESLLVSAGMTVDSARDNVGVLFAVEPRFLPTGRLGRVGGAQIPPAGAFGLE